jgi:serine/threonine protein kinase/tetratricopeptide (TPR) repeat protein
MAETQSTLSPGEIIGHYRIVGVAGAGGMGVVYKAFDQQLERTVALKFLPTSTMFSTKEKERFLKEARAASSLDHPNIGVIYGVEDLSVKRSYIVMAFYEGKSLADTIHEGPIACEKALDIALQMALGLEHAHRHKIVHRDIKPSNVMVTPEGVAKIVDFGLAGLIKSEIETVSGETAGTIGYMSPEQTLGKPVDQRTDIWAWGIVLVEMLTGWNPYRRDNVPATVNAILSEAPHGIEQISALLQPIAYHALAKHPQDRYQSCAEILSELGFAKNQINSSTELGDLSAPRRPIDAVNLKNYVVAATGVGANETSRKRMVIAVTSLIALLLVSGLFFTTSLRDRFSGTEQPKHIAILPFDNIGDDPANEPLVAGLMDTMAGKLSNLEVNDRSLWVVPVSEVRRRNIKDPSTALRDLGATLAVKGSFEREGKDVHLTSNLIETKSLRQIGSVVLENGSGDLSALQDETVSQLARLMKVSVGDNTKAESPELGKPAAYEEYLKGLGYMQRYDKPGNLDSAVESLEQAVRTDPRFALAYAQLGEAYRLKYVLDQNPKWLEQALPNCQKAAELGDRAVYVTLGRIHEINGKHDLAIQEFQHALEFDPRDAEALGGIATSYENAGRIQDAEATFKKAAAMRPDYWNGYNALALFYDRQGKYSEAIVQLNKAIELTPDNAQVYLNLGAVYSDTGDVKLFPNAELALRKSLELSPSYAAYANLGNLYYLEKKYSESAAMTEKALQLNGNNYLVWYNLIQAYKWLKETDKAEAAREQMLEVLLRTTNLKPQDALAQSVIAIVYAETKLKEKAVMKIQTALALSPDDPEVMENVGIAYEKLGDRRQALACVQKALQKGFERERVMGDPDLRNLVADSKFPPPIEVAK